MTPFTMRKEDTDMKTLKISSRNEGHRVIDAIGDNEAEIRRLQSENKKLRALVEEWALENPDEAFAGDGRLMADETKRYAYRMEKASPALRVQSHLTVDDVIQMLGATQDTERYVMKTYDAEEIKADFGTSEAKRKKIEVFGLYFTRPEPHLKVGEKA